MQKYPDYEKRAAACVTFLRKEYPGTVRKQCIDGAIKWVWSNIDCDLFTFDTEEEAAADAALEMGVTIAELDAVGR
jgi:hypothetical protein